MFRVVYKTPRVHISTIASRSFRLETKTLHRALHRALWQAALILRRVLNRKCPILQHAKLLWTMKQVEVLVEVQMEVELVLMTEYSSWKSTNQRRSTRMSLVETQALMSRIRKLSLKSSECVLKVGKPQLRSQICPTVPQQPKSSAVAELVVKFRSNRIMQEECKWEKLVKFNPI